MDSFRSFMSHLKRREVIGLAIGVMIATSVTMINKSFVDDVVEPLINPFIEKFTAQKTLSELELKLGPVHLRIGSFLKSIIQIIVIGITIVNLGKIARKHF